MKREDKIIWGLAAGLLILLNTCGCRVNHKTSGKIETTNEVKAKIEVDYPICQGDGTWTFEMKMQCIDLCNNYELKIETSDEMAELLETLKKQEDVVEPENTLGGI